MHQDPSRQVRTGVLFPITLIYILLPGIIFLTGWVRWYWAAPVILLWLWLAGRAVFSEMSFPDSGGRRILPGTHLFLIALAAYVTFATGVGGFVGQCDNYVGWDNLKLYDLIVHPWPVVYPEKEAFYCYYFGYYLPVALFTRLAGNIHLAEYFSFIWAWAGVTLCIYWIYVLLQLKRAWMVVIFLLTGTFAAALTSFNTLELRFLRFGEDIAYPYTFIRTWWTGNRSLWNTDVPFHCSLHYASTMTTMAWAPYHYISGILFPALVWYRIGLRKTFSAVPLILAAAMIWSPFVTLGLLPVVLYGVVKYLREVFNRDTLLAAVSALPFLFYFSAHSTSEEMVRGFIWSCGNRWWLNYLAFVSVEVGLFTILIIAQRKYRQSLSYRTLIAINVAALILIPFVYLGFYNDFSVKVGIVPLFFLVLVFARLVGRILEDLLEHGIHKIGFWPCAALIAWVLSTVVPVNILLHPVFPHPLYAKKTKISEPFVSDTIRNLSNNLLSSQFLGDVHNPAYKLLLKPPAEPDSTAKSAPSGIQTP